MLGCKKFLTYKRKRLTGNSHLHGNGCPGLDCLVSVPKEKPLCGPDLYDKFIDKRPLEAEAGNSSSNRVEAEKDVEESGKGTSNEDDVGPSSMDLSSSCGDHVLGDNECIDGSLASHSMGTSAITADDCIGEKPSIEVKMDFESREKFSTSKSTIVEASDSCAKDKPKVCVAAEVTKFRAPLLTFVRRCKRKRNEEVADTRNKLLVDETELSTVAKRYRVVRDNTVLRESGNGKGGSVDDVINLKPPTEIQEVGSICAQIETTPHAKVLVCEGEEPRDDRSVSKDVMHEDEEVIVRNDQISVGVQRDLSMGNLGVSLNEDVKDSFSNNEDAGKQQSNDHEPERGKSQAILNDGLTATAEGSRQFLDLSVTPTDSGGTVECHAYLESNSKKQSVHAVPETLLGSLDSTSRSRAAISHQTSSLEVFVEGTNANCEDNDRASFRPHDFMSENKCLQLFAEERTEDSFRSEFTQPEVTNPVRRKSPPFLGLSLPTRPKTTRFASNIGFPTFPFLNTIDETPQPYEDTLPQPSSTHLTSLLRHKSMLDGIVNRARALSERDIFQDKIKLYTSAWTEEELDSLWVGVRRYGRDNWNAMIRDPRLRFSSWRVARDLAEQWEEEQSKLFQRPIPLPLLKAKAKAKGVSLGFNNFGATIKGIRGESMAEETRLSLGDVYNRSERKVSRRAKFKRSGDNAYLHRPGKNPYLDYQSEHYKDEVSNCFIGKTMPINNPSSTIGLTKFMSAKGNLPHWLKEAVFSSIPSQREPLSAPNISSFSHPHMIQATLPYLDHYELYLGRSNDIDHLGVGLMRNDLQTFGEGHRFNHSSETNHVADVIVIESDRSSEETISDDHCCRP